MKAENLPQFIANNLHNFFSARLHDLFVTRAAEKAANERAILRRSMRKFIVDEGARKHTSAFAARHEQSEDRRKRGPHFFVVTKRDGLRRAVLNDAQIPRD